MAEKNYSGFVGVDQFHYKVLGEDEVQVSTPERVQFLQEVELEFEEELVRAYGDNVTAEIAKSVGNVTLTSSFHKIPLEDKAKLFNLTVDNGLYFAGGSNGISYIACMFARTTNEGGMEYVGLFKGVFKMSNIEGATAEDEVEFGSEESEAEFMPVEVTDVGSAAFVLGYDKKGETTNRDRIYELVFGTAHPDAGEGTDPEGA